MTTPATPPAAAPRASVVMATRNRKDELRRAIQSCLSQTLPVEIIINDDGSTDGTGDMVRAEFPMVRYGRSETPKGSIVNRNKAVRDATTNFIISIDDDAALVSPRTVEQTLAEFDHPRVGAIAIPYIDVLKGPETHQRAPQEPATGNGAAGPQVWCINYFRGCAAAWRRDVFLSVGGYAETLYHMAEEPELCMRLLNAGYVCRLGNADPVHHFESPNRDPKRILKQTARNGVMMGWLNAPALMLPAHLAGTGLNALRYGLKTGSLRQMGPGILKGYADCLPNWKHRRPMSRQAYFLYRWLSKRPRATLAELESRLPPLRHG
jgi:glycosyltransferase involved in cell wall biosynthesis